MYNIIGYGWTYAFAPSERKKYTMFDLQKASVLKRISAYILDAILLSIVAVLFMLILSSAVGYNRYADTVNAAYDMYGEKYGVDLRMSSSEYEKLDDEGVSKVQAAFSEMNDDIESRNALGMMMELSVLIASCGLLVAFLALEFIVPLLFGNGQTIGKKIFGIGIMHTDHIKLSAPMLFARSILGKFAMETMVPVYIIIMMYFGTIGIVGPAVLLLLIVLEAAVLIFTSTNSMIHDLLAKSVTVDLASQKIFATKEELVALKEKMHAEKAQRQEY